MAAAAAARPRRGPGAGAGRVVAVGHAAAAGPAGPALAPRVRGGGRVHAALHAGRRKADVHGHALKETRNNVI